MKPMTDAELLTRDRRQSAVHEAAHLTIAIATGVRASAYIAPSHSNDSLRNKTFVGQMQLRSLLDCRSMAMVCAAGYVAEVLNEEPDLHVSDITDGMVSDEASLSPTDRRGIEFYVSTSDFDAMVKLVICVRKWLQRNATYHAWAVDRLLSEGEITAVEAAEAAKSIPIVKMRMWRKK
jgi:hypothetical protein